MLILKAGPDKTWVPDTCFLSKVQKRYTILKKTQVCFYWKIVMSFLPRPLPNLYNYLATKFSNGDLDLNF